jgi:hypothetical protein
MPFAKVIISFLFFGWISSAVFAQTTTFTATTGNWSVPSNWNNGIPTSTTAAIISVGSTCSVDIASAQCASLTLNGGNGETRLSIGTGGSLSVSGSTIVNPPTNGSRTNGIFITGTGSFTCQV